jgi:hypothetical protein
VSVGSSPFTNALDESQKPAFPPPLGSLKVFSFFYMQACECTITDAYHGCAIYTFFGTVKANGIVVAGLLVDMVAGVLVVVERGQLHMDARGSADAGADHGER